MSVNGVMMQEKSLQKGYDYTRKHYSDFRAENFNSNILKLNAPEEDVVTINSKDNAKVDYLLDDGIISAEDKLFNFAKGVISPITSMFKSPKNFLIGVGTIAGIGALTVATGGAITPLLVTAGLVGGTVQFGVSAYKASSATTDEEACQAWQGIGSGTSAIVGSVLGAKSAAKAANIVGADDMNAIEATIACVKNSPKALQNSINSFTGGKVLSNLGLQKVANADTEAIATQQSDDGVKLTEVLKRKDGTKRVVKYSDGTEIHYNRKGDAIWQKFSDGTIEYYDGDNVVFSMGNDGIVGEIFDGNDSYITAGKNLVGKVADGTAKYSKSGTLLYDKIDGVFTQYDSDGRVILEVIDGIGKIFFKDGSSIFVKY